MDKGNDYLEVGDGSWAEKSFSKGPHVGKMKSIGGSAGSVCFGISISVGLVGIFTLKFANFLKGRQGYVFILFVSNRLVNKAAGPQSKHRVELAA